MDKRDITIKTDDGTARASLFGAGIGGTNRPGIILYMDAFGPRAALDDMAARMAGDDAIVLVPDLFYRFGDYGPYDAKTAFSNDESKSEIMGMINGTSLDQSIADTKSWIEALDAAGATGRIGTTGYCMGGNKALAAATAYPDRVAAAASFHGGNLAPDQAGALHTRVGTIKGRVYVGLAGVDGSCPPDQSARLEMALREAEVDHIIENYVGMAHGWTVSDHGVYDEAGAERHWKRLTTLFGETLY